MTETRIRSAEPHDAEILARLSGQLGYPAERAVVSERLSRILGKSDHAVFVAEHGESGVAGWVHVFAADRIESPAFAELGGLVVAEEVRGQGVGRALVERAGQWARDHGLEHIRVRSNVARADAHAFYEHLGFETIKSQAVFRKALRVAEA